MIPLEDEQHELCVHRMASLIPMLFLCLLFVGYLATRMFGLFPYVDEFYITVPTGSLVAKTPVPTDMPPIRITDDGTVIFSVLQLPRSDHDLDSLVLHLRQIAPHISPGDSLPVLPDPNSHHQRLMEVLSAIRRSGIRHYHLL